MEDLDFDFNLLVESMIELVSRSLTILIPVFLLLLGGGVLFDLYLVDMVGAQLLLVIGQFVISYLLVKGLAKHAGLLGESGEGPGFGSYFGLSFIMGLGIGLGYILLILPGIFLSIRWMLAFPILFSDDDPESGTDALGKSWELTGPVFWKLLAAYLVSIAMTAISLYAYIYPAASFDQTTQMIGLIVANVAVAAGMIYNLVLGFAAFLLLRHDKDSLARIFA